jgi:hypothetical protein
MNDVMLRPSLSLQKSSRGTRRGLASSLLLVSLVLTLGLLGLAVELSLVQHVQLQLQDAADAAALAGAPELFDRSVLYPGQKPDIKADIEKAFATARKWAAENVAAGDLVRLGDSRAFADEDLTAGWLAEPLNRREPMIEWPQTKQVNTLRVHAERSHRRGNPVRMIMARMAGLGSADVEGEAWATIDQRVYGFRPQMDGVIPVIPVSVPAYGESVGWFDQATQPALAGTTDRFSWDEHTGTVKEGPDGIPEIEVTFQIDSQEASVSPSTILLWIGDAPAANEHRALRQCRDGITQTDLVDYNEQLALDKELSLWVPGTSEMSAELVECLKNLTGDVRVWPLFNSIDDQSDPLRCQLTNFGAGGIVDVRADDQGLIQVRVQPTVMVVSTALVRPLRKNQQPNPWIAKLFLTH